MRLDSPGYCYDWGECALDRGETVWELFAIPAGINAASVQSATLTLHGGAEVFVGKHTSVTASNCPVELGFNGFLIDTYGSTDPRSFASENLIGVVGASQTFTLDDIGTHETWPGLGMLSTARFTQVVDVTNAVKQLVGSGGSTSPVPFTLEFIEAQCSHVMLKFLTPGIVNWNITTADLVAINIKPDSDPNSINTCSGGATPVTIFGSPDLDVENINVDSLTLASASVKTVGKSDRMLCKIDDRGSVNSEAFDSLGDPDGIDDLTCHFMTIELSNLEDDSTTADLNGNLNDGTAIIGQDSVNIVKDCDPT